MEASEASSLSQAPERSCGPPPPEADYATLEQAWEAIQAHASVNGYRMVKNGTKPGRARFRCAKGRDYKPQANPETHESKRRKTRTQFTGCKFQLAARRLSNGRWAIELFDGPGASHNHGWSNPTAFAAARADALSPLSDEVIKLVNNGARPFQVLATIQAQKRGILGKDVNNLLQRHRRAELRGRSPLQCLYEDHLEPEASQFVWEDSRDTHGHVTSLTIAPKAVSSCLSKTPIYYFSTRRKKLITMICPCLTPVALRLVTRSLIGLSPS